MPSAGRNIEIELQNEVKTDFKKLKEYMTQKLSDFLPKSLDHMGDRIINEINNDNDMYAAYYAKKYIPEKWVGPKTLADAEVRYWVNNMIVEIEKLKQLSARRISETDWRTMNQKYRITDASKFLSDYEFACYFARIFESEKIDPDTEAKVQSVLRLKRDEVELRKIQTIQNEILYKAFVAEIDDIGPIKTYDQELVSDLFLKYEAIVKASSDFCKGSASFFSSLTPDQEHQFSIFLLDLNENVMQPKEVTENHQILKNITSKGDLKSAINKHFLRSELILIREGMSTQHQTSLDDMVWWVENNFIVFKLDHLNRETPEDKLTVSFWKEPCSVHFGRLEPDIHLEIVFPSITKNITSGVFHGLLPSKIPSGFTDNAYCGKLGRSN